MTRLRKAWGSRLALLLWLAALPGLPGCASSSPPSIRLALDGPPLAVRGESGDARYVGHMDRSLMAGFGHAMLRQPDTGLFCEGEADMPPTDKGRVYIGLTCSDGRAMHMLLRNLGPDQGLGLGRFEESEEVIDLFYHACEVEALRRLDSFRAEMAETRAGPP